MRLNWFSPLPPAKSGIADYTMRFLPALAKVADIVLWTDQETWDPRLAHFADVRTYHLKEIPWADLNRGTMSVFHIGNNHRFHGPIWQVSQRHPGLVILHDIALQQFFAGMFREQRHDRAGYLNLMEHYYGTMGRQDAEDFWIGRLTIEYMAQHYRLARCAVEHALGVVVHTWRSAAELESELACPVVHAPLPYPAMPRTDQPTGRAKDSGKLGPPYHLIVFGHISDNRRLGSLLQALAGLSEREQFRLDVYGELWDSARVIQQIHTLELQHLVTLHDFVPAEELARALDAAHMAVNLRFPTMGEASVSQLQIWDHALPSLVTRIGWYADLPEETVAFVRPEHEIEDIQTHLRAFRATPSRYAKIGEHGRRLLETQHVPAAYAQAIVDLVEEAQAFRPHAMTHDLARRVGAEMAQWTKRPAKEVTSYLWGQVVGLPLAEPGERHAMAEIDYHHLEVLKDIQRTLARQSQHLQRQLWYGLQALRRAALEECYTLQPPRGPQAAGLPTPRGDLSGPPIVTTPQAIAEISPVAAGQELTLRDGTTDEQPHEASVSAGGGHGVMGEDGLRKSYTREDALRYPMSLQAHDTGFRYLFNFLIVARSLGLRPGDLILDFGAGSCFVSELLNRFGYMTVALDNDHKVLAIGQERLSIDPRCDAQRARFVAGDGMRLPFRDASFDGVICMNALHHMPDYQGTLAEMGRILKAGGRAVFAEPGDQHSKSPESILAMEQYGALEKDVVLSEVYQLARAAGFQRMILKPYVVPELLELDYEEFERFSAGGTVSNPFFTPAEIAAFVRGQPLFCLQKAGARPLTSANAPSATLRARIIVKECPSRVPSQGRFKVVALCENIGESLWLARPREFGGYVTFGVKLLTPDGRVLEDDRGRQHLMHDVPPGGRIEVVSDVSVEGLQPGRYRVLFDMVNELVCWFQSVGSDVVERWVEVV